MDQHERMRILGGRRARDPPLSGLVGDLVARELLTWEEFGHRLGSAGPIMQLVDAVMKQPFQAESDVA